MSEKDKKKKRHLHRITSEYAGDGSVVHHHTYKDDPDAGPEDERRNVATSSDADEAGQHVADQFGMNGPEATAEGAEGEPPAGEAEPDATQMMDQQ